jgi:DNA-binding PadR family transcriptional regulator
LHHQHHHHHGAAERSEEAGSAQGRGDGRRRRHGQPPWGRGGFAAFGAGGPRRGRRTKRGDVRSAVLLLLEEQPRTGYQLIQELTERSGGAWQPSPGSIYPVLSQLEDEGLVTPDTSNDGRGFTLTDAGRTEVEAKREQMGKPWEAAAAGISEPRFELIGTARQVAAAVRQVMEIGTESQVARASEILTEARRRIYQLLAEDAPPAS